MIGKAGWSHNNAYFLLWKTALDNWIHGPPDAMNWPLITYIESPESDKEDKNQTESDDSNDEYMGYSERNNEFTIGNMSNTMEFGMNECAIVASSTTQHPADTATQIGGANLDLLRLLGTSPAVVVVPATAAAVVLPMTEAEHGLSTQPTNGPLGLPMQAGQDCISPREEEFI